MTDRDDRPESEGQQGDESGAEGAPEGGAEGAPDDQPDLDGDDYVDVPEDVAEQVAAEDAPAAPADEEDGDEPTDEPAEQGDPLTTGTSVGDLYCNALGMGATLARDRRGEGVDRREQQADEYADIARQLDLDDFVDEWVEQHGGTGDLSPGQGIAVGTTMFALAVLVDDPELADGLAAEVGA